MWPPDPIFIFCDFELLEGLGPFFFFFDKQERCIFKKLMQRIAKHIKDYKRKKRQQTERKETNYKDIESFMQRSKKHIKNYKRKEKATNREKRN